MASGALDNKKFDSSTIRLYIVKYDGALDSSQEPTRRGIDNAFSGTILNTIVRDQLGNETADFSDNFVNMQIGRILCVNTQSTLSLIKSYEGLKFTIVEMPAEFVTETLTSAYQYGEGLQVIVKSIRNENGVEPIRYLDSNIKGRSVTGITKTANGIGVWS